MLDVDLFDYVDVDTDNNNNNEHNRSNVTCYDDDNEDEERPLASPALALSRLSAPTIIGNIQRSSSHDSHLRLPSSPSLSPVAVAANAKAAAATATANATDNEANTNHTTSKHEYNNIDDNDDIENGDVESAAAAAAAEKYKRQTVLAGGRATLAGAKVSTPIAAATTTATSTSTAAVSGKSSSSSLVNSIRSPNSKSNYELNNLRLVANSDQRYAHSKFIPNDYVINNSQTIKLNKKSIENILRLSNTAAASHSSAAAAAAAAVAAATNISNDMADSPDMLLNSQSASGRQTLIISFLFIVFAFAFLLLCHIFSLVIYLFCLCCCFFCCRAKLASLAQPALVREQVKHWHVQERRRVVRQQGSTAQSHLAKPAARTPVSRTSCCCNVCACVCVCVLCKLHPRRSARVVPAWSFVTLVLVL